ncbi:hypothetical protein L227DRAFT_506511 [Lentinus tigrinus ALCF2SS1-6]|uniref:F-box domain-containing protein n=2 Tax=Lentinus tigrinus TaxID=5365 RepID=A0A5C2S258_9APHY|nr:hypothetical protein L227DRAFT_506511 [Lentinus tigrinus ALCF2SS1-6]
MLPLPFDIIHTLFSFTTIRDLVNFCSTCKALHQHLANDSLWKKLCAPYGLRDFTYFGGLSPFTIYTKLIHPYAPILGLWANDHPFRSNVLEFKLISGDEEEQGGIVGEVWSFSAHADRNPIPPSYIRATKISFESDPGEEEVGQPAYGDGTAEADASVRIFCYSDPSTPSIRHPARLSVRAETKTRARIQFYRRVVSLPEFPMPSSHWCDETSRLPRLPEEPESQLNQSSIIQIYPAARLPLIWVEPSSVRKPPAMSIRCLRPNPENCPWAALHVPTIPFESLDPRPPRYYPLRRTILPGVDPRSSNWSLQNMEGLWYGSFGIDGTELLYLTTMDSNGIAHLVATKITGDVHIPRGYTSWTLHTLEEGGILADAVRHHWAMSLQAASIVADTAVLSPARILTGKGCMASPGFKDVDAMLITGGVINADELQIAWPHAFRTFWRYKGRDVASNLDMGHDDTTSSGA